jgi:hypothetical protein
MGEKGGQVYDTERLQRELLRADMCAVATSHCFEHGSHVVDAILDRFNVTRKNLKEKK